MVSTPVIMEILMLKGESVQNEFMIRIETYPGSVIAGSYKLRNAVEHGSLHLVPATMECKRPGIALNMFNQSAEDIVKLSTMLATR